MKHSHIARTGANAGFSLVSAIFLLVVLAALGVAMVNISSVQHAGSALDVQGARAYQAARAGIEWGLYRQIREGVCAGGDVSFQLPEGSTLNQFTVTVNCTRTPAATAGMPDRFRIRAIACNLPTSTTPPSCPNQSGAPDYVQRTMQVDF
ncbi:pilus assembly PilX N-terminal domain-containing protein [Noviherbaspirillum aridicola]|uniref:MSHA biogenesis protein MshP n=1 Tax=Noviherbaspirillum aridicola TaxID=2849687 RepID=A0ABQ4Q610_9BURK|nr:pilus assembly PilX N-terminal domain-containing protein [Noviherbaspirillum aridicola]GIZ52431.1 hypothetical protein NCCP691_24450 [Noviherbaspirillum aridicola]